MKKKLRLTKRTVDALVCRDGQEYDFCWDDDISGFGVKVYPSGAKTFVFQYRTAEGRTKRFTIGKYSESLTPDQARKIAKDKSVEVYAGHDPQAEKLARRHALSVNELLDLFVKSEQFAANATKTQQTDRGRIDRHLRPLLGRQIADSMTEESIKRAHRAIAGGKTAARVKTKPRGLAKVTGGEGTADKSILLLSTAFRWAIKNKFLADNPAASMKFAPSGVRDTVLKDAADYGRLFATLDTMQSEKRIRPAVADAIRLISLTGARRGEAAGLLWRYVDLDRGLITIPPRAHKAGRKTGRPRIIALPALAKEIIARQPAGDADAFVFGPAKGQGALALSKAWLAVRKSAELPAKLGLHGLRHSIGTALAADGATAIEIMEQLGHRQVSTSLKYIHWQSGARSTLAERAASTALAGLAVSRAEEADAAPKA